MLQSPKLASPSISALVSRNGSGHQFVCYGDCCSGIAAAPHAANFAAVNRIVSQLCPQPEFICFLGDEIKGLSADDDMLRSQWRYWFDHEMAWLDRDITPLYHCTANHTTYDVASEEVFRDVLSHLPQNGPPGQEGLSYFVRRQDLLLIFINTMWSGLGGEGRIETTWLEQVLANNADASYKLVLGHHPVYPVNGFAGPYQRTIEPESGGKFWEILVRHQVQAYICSHIMSFDVQVHAGILQILTAGAGTEPLMPADIEYLHCVQFALDAQGLRYQVLDTLGHSREWLSWPLELPPSCKWSKLNYGIQDAPRADNVELMHTQSRILAWRFDGIAVSSATGMPQTLLNAWNPGPHLAPLWIGLLGPEQRLALLLSPEPGRSPRFWLGPTLASSQPFSIQIAMHTGMGPGGMLWRWDDASPWSSLHGATAWGAERLDWQSIWSIGHDQQGVDGRLFRGDGLTASWYTQTSQ